MNPNTRYYLETLKFYADRLIEKDKISLYDISYFLEVIAKISASEHRQMILDESLRGKE